METILRSVFDEWEKVSSREELLEELKEYRFILSSYVYEYFRDLIDCEVSILSHYCKNDEVFRNEKVTGLDIYRKIGIYNIYHQALDLFLKEKSHFPIEIGGNERGIEGLRVEGRVNDIVFPLFDYNYSMTYDTFNRLSVNDGCKVVKIGDIDLYRSIVINEIRNLNGDNYKRIIEVLKKLRREKNPYKYGDYVSDVQKSHTWEYYRNKKLMYYNRLLSVSNDSERNYDVLLKASKIQDYFSDLLRKNYGLEEDSSFDSEAIHGNAITLSKKYPCVRVSEHTKYI